VHALDRENSGKPCAGKLHARFEEGGGGGLHRPSATRLYFVVDPSKASTKAIVPGRDISGKESRDGNPPEELAVDLELDLVNVRCSLLFSIDFFTWNFRPGPQGPVMVLLDALLEKAYRLCKGALVETLQETTSVRTRKGIRE